MEELIKEYLFPHETIRPVQDTFLKEAYNALNNKENILIHAPTGIGKTLIGLMLTIERQKKFLNLGRLTPRWQR